MKKYDYHCEGGIYHTEENLSALSNLDSLEAAMAEGKILEAPAVRCDNSLTLTVDLGKFCGIMEKNEVALVQEGETVKDIAVITRVGKPVCFKILSIDRTDPKNPEIRLSRRAAQLECMRRYLSFLHAGDIIPAKVTHLEHFGAFVDIGCGIVSLLSIDSISVSRISHPKDRLDVGGELSVVVRSVERGDNGLPSRIFVSRKELLGSWEENAALFEIGQTVTGIVRSVEPYGIFVELTPNLAGLAEYRDDITVGQTAAVYIKSMIPERMKIKLVIVDSYRGVSRVQPEIISSELIEKGHISSFRYSPSCSEKIIESVFDAD